MAAAAETRSEVYQTYLQDQLDRSILKKANDTSVKTLYLLRQLSRYLPPAPGLKVLCLGARNGFELNRFLQQGYNDVRGIDLHSLDPRIEVMDMHRLAYADRSFDIVYCCHTLELALNPRVACSEAFRVLKPGGYVVIESPKGANMTPEWIAANPVTPAGTIAPHLKNAAPVEPLAVNFRTPEDIANLFESCSLVWSETGPAVDNPQQRVLRIIVQRPLAAQPKHSQARSPSSAT
jgi:SAM-dependent methyltransferase